MTGLLSPLGITNQSKHFLDSTHFLFTLQHQKRHEKNHGPGSMHTEMKLVLISDLIVPWLCCCYGSSYTVDHTMWIARQKDSSFGAVVVKTPSFSGNSWKSWHILNGLHLARQRSLCGKQQAMAFGQVENSFYAGIKNSLYFIFCAW